MARKAFSVREVLPSAGRLTCSSPQSTEVRRPGAWSGLAPVTMLYGHSNNLCWILAMSVFFLTAVVREGEGR